MSEWLRIGDIPGLGSEYSFSKKDGFRLLRARGAVKAEVQFSGGNDEGGADKITLTLADESTVDLDAGFAWVDEEGNVSEYVDGKHARRPATPEERVAFELWRTLEAPLNYKYGSWAGDFSVSGVLTWDVAEGTVEEEGILSSYEGYSDSF